MSKKITLNPPRGTRDYYPELMAKLRWIFETWRDVSVQHGFVEYDGPIFENLELFQIKSGEEIASQLFHFEDRGGRALAIRPEITPTLARMIAQKANSLPRPVKWFSIPRLCRAERPQRGRLREFFQWNIDIIGSDSVLADAECMFVAIDFLRKVGLGADTIELKVNSRTIISSLLIDANISESRHEHIFAIMDKYEKLSTQQFDEYAKEQGLSADELSAVKDILKLPDLDSVKTLVKSQQSRDELDKLNQLCEYLSAFGIEDYFAYRPSVVRGLAYYTGIVFEIFDRSAKLRAIAGGGRYNHLIKLFNGPDMPATGFGMGDVVLLELLEELEKVPDFSKQSCCKFFIIDADKQCFNIVLKIAADLRKQNISVSYSAKRQSLGKQLKSANQNGAQFAIIVGQETQTKNIITIKNLKTSQQQQIRLNDFLSKANEIEQSL